MRRSREQTLSVAFHEAGHAVIGYRQSRRFGWIPNYVHIDPGEGMVAAGPIAEFEYDGGEDGWKGDWEQVDACMLYLPRSERFYWSRARQMVLRNWHAIEAVAKLLLRRKYLDGVDLERIIKRADRRAARAGKAACSVWEAAQARKSKPQGRAA
jgi:hypothetical protein